MKKKKEKKFLEIRLDKIMASAGKRWRRGEERESVAADN